jgi:hypothetical protein
MVYDAREKCFSYGADLPTIPQQTHINHQVSIMKAEEIVSPSIILTIYGI